MNRLSDAPSGDVFDFCCPTRVWYGWGARRRLAPLVGSLRKRHMVLVTDTHWTQRSLVASELAEGLRETGVAVTVFDGCQADPTVAQCDAAAAWVQGEARRLGQKVDGVIALGGGSAIDLAKALCVVLPEAAQGAPTLEFVGLPTLPHAPLDLFALPTTSGAGSEITPGAILLKDSAHAKAALMSNELRAKAALVDPELTLTCPPRVTADAGMDALTHAIESYLTLDARDFGAVADADPGYSGRNPLTMHFAREAIRLGFAHLPTAFADGSDRNAREGMALCSLYAALSYASAGLNAVHALAYGLASVTHETHGRTNAVLLPYAMEALAANPAAQRTRELADIARLAGSIEARETEAANEAGPRVRALIESLGMPTTLRQMGLDDTGLKAMLAEGLAVVRLNKAWPGRQVAEDYPAIAKAAMG
jgi:alcohol dehydrogenase